MARNRKKKKNQNHEEKPDRFVLPYRLKRIIFGTLFFLLSLIFLFSFFELAGFVGEILINSSKFLIGRTIFILPIIFLFSGVVFLLSPYKRFTPALILAISLLLFGFSGILGSLNQGQEVTESFKMGGWIGNILENFIVKLFGFWIGQIIFGIMIFIGIIIFLYLIKGPLALKRKERLEANDVEEAGERTTLIRKIFSPKFESKEIPPFSSETKEKNQQEVEKDQVKISSQEPKVKTFWDYKTPPLELLELEKGSPSSGDTKLNSAIIRKTLQNFDIPVEMSGVSIGPTVTQYALKPAEGIKLSRITALSSDLSLALAAQSIRIEAPIPGRSLVGIEVPNKVRAQVRLRNLINNPAFQLNVPDLNIALGKDVSGIPFYANLAKMPHMLVAGSTGSGKTIFLNSLLMNLLYKNSPASLRLILVDPKRVEFPVYSGLPHLLCPVIFNATLTCNALRWLVGEMERRFDLLVEIGARDIIGYNEKINKKMNNSKEESNSLEPMPYIVLVIDELADLMAAKGREVEGSIVRIAQMARAVGIHLVLATQRPSVEVITGLIKANIISRVTFQVASQVDSRTIIDSAGAEKLLGAGDMLHISGEISKPKRIQCPYISEKEIKKVVDYIKSVGGDNLTDGKEILTDNSLSEDLEKALHEPETGTDSYSDSDDVMYEEAKRVVIEARKASASLLQRRLRIGYARAARLIDILEEKGVVGPAEGAKPREILSRVERSTEELNQVNDEGPIIEDSDDGWKKI